MDFDDLEEMIEERREAREEKQTGGHRPFGKINGLGWIALILAVVLFGSGFGIGALVFREDKAPEPAETSGGISEKSPIYVKKPHINTDYLYSVLTESSELTTCKMHVNSILKYFDKGIKLFNRSDFIMTYDVAINAGVDISKIVITVDEENLLVKVNLPNSKVFDAYIANPESIEYFDEGFAPFNPDSKKDANRAQAMAIDDAKEKALNMGIFAYADKNAETAVRAVLGEIVAKSGYTLLVNDKLGEGVTTTAKPTVTATDATPTTTTKAA